MCSIKCLDCNGPEENMCLSCYQGSIFYENQCILLCPKGTFIIKELMTCQACH